MVVLGGELFLVSEVPLYSLRPEESIFAENVNPLEIMECRVLVVGLRKFRCRPCMVDEYL